MNRRLIKFLSVFLFLCFLFPEVHAQLGKITFDLQKDKPEKFKTKTLKSEKTGQKKFTVPRRFIQNTVSHYNYFFNANNKIKKVIETARLKDKDNYAVLLPFYGYSLTTTASQKKDLDSVIYKATAGILLHDLRSDWVDNLYLLIGEAYYFRKTFDSAAMTFQFINYNLFPRKKKSEDDQLIVGSNENGNTNAVSVSSKENRNIIDRTFSRPPSRNDALVWQIKTLIEANQFSDAAGLINTLQNDPQFPSRLHSFLEETQAYWFYKQQMYDSAVIHLVKSLPNAIDMEDRARREYLIAQLYEMNNNQDTASDYYDRAIKHTVNPLLDIYANLNKAKMLKGTDSVEINKSIDKLVHMAKKERFELYRDIIYYSAAQLALGKPDTSSAVSFYKKSIFYNQTNLSYKNKSFLTIAEIRYQQKNYKESYAYYDSIQTKDTSLGDVSKIIARRNALAQVVKQIDIIEREDSLQAIAALSPADRDAFLKKLSKRLQKERGIKDQDIDYTNPGSGYDSRNQSSNIFGNNQAQGDWYFYNASLKSKGYTDFKTNWGKRENADNWRLNADQGYGSRGPGGNPDVADSLSGAANPGLKNSKEDISVAGLLANVPLTKPKMDTSNKKIAISLFQLGKNYQNLLEDYNAAIETYLRSLKRFPDSLHQGEIYLNLSYCYRKIGNLAQADYYKNLLLSKFSKSKFTQYVIHPESFDPSKKDTAATRRYDSIYNLFIEGNFDQAVKEKQLADSLYGNSYWSPQLLYIQSVYYIRQRQDSAATNILNQIIIQYPHSPLREKAATMISVLDRRDSIEKYLTNLHVVRVKEDSQIVVFDDTRLSGEITHPTRNDSNLLVKKAEPLSATKQVVINPDKKLAPVIKNTTFTFDPNAPQNVVIVLDKVDPVYVNEARNAFNRYNRENFYNLNLQITKDTLDKDRMLLVVSQFDDADLSNKYRDKIKRDAPSEVSWLPANKYSFYIISNANLELLKQNKNLQSYIELLNKKYPGKF